MRAIRCGCSRCILQYKVSNSGDWDYGAEEELKKICFEDRRYQTALIEYAKTHNIMACLPTGSGKTFIALKLIEHFRPSLQIEKKKIFFLANTIPLVNQQAGFIARNSSFKVCHLTGDMDVDYWSEEKWATIVGEHEVITMIGQIFLNMLNHGYIKFSQIALIIFDECHHASAKHPMAIIMKEYATAQMMDKFYQLPRILGLSATIIKGNCEPSQVSSKIQELEDTMKSIAITYKDYEEVLACSTSSVIERVIFDTNNRYTNDIYIRKMEEMSKELQKLRNDRKKEKMLAAKISPESVDKSLTSFKNIFEPQKKPSPGDLKVALDDVLHIYKELGPYCTIIAVKLRIAFIKFCLMDINDGKVSMWYRQVLRYFQEFKGTLQSLMYVDAVDEKKANERNVSTFVSPKLKKLLEILKKFRIYETQTAPCEYGNDERLCGLIFTDRRTTAQVIAWYLKDLAEYCKNDYGFLKAHFVVGTSRSAFESVESRVYARKQNETITMFRTKQLNILAATSVLEEGIDVPSCNLVVRLDPIPSYTSFIQSMGRARKKGAKFYAFLPDNDFHKKSAQLNTFLEINKRIIAHLQNNLMKIDADCSFSSKFEKDLILPICPGQTADSPRITMDSACEVIERYCNILPTDGIASLSTLAWWNEYGNSYAASLKFPLNSVIKNTVVGIRMKSKDLSKQAAEMEACRLLLEANVFNDQLIPVHPTLPIPVQRFFNNLVPRFGDGTSDDAGEEASEDGEIREESQKTDGEKNTEEDAASTIFRSRSEWYPKRHPKVLTEAVLRPCQPYHAYKINFERTKELAEVEENWSNLYDFKNAKESFGIISRNKLPNIGLFPLFGVFGTIHCSLTEINLKGSNGKVIELDERSLENMQDTLPKLFGDILGLKHPLLEDTPSVPFVLVGLINVLGEWKIFERMKKEIDEISTIQRMKRPFKNSQTQVQTEISYDKKFRNVVVFPWYKNPFKKPAYLVESIDNTKNPQSLSPSNPLKAETYQSFLETEFKVRLQNMQQPLLKCKLAGINIGRVEKDPVQLNYLIKKYNKEDEDPVFLVPECCYSVNVPATLIVQLKLLPSALHRINRLLLAHEILTECSQRTGWPDEQSLITEDISPALNELDLMSSAHEHKRKEEEQRRKRRIELREEKLRPRKMKPDPTNKQSFEDRELHYEFIHPNKIEDIDIKLFHEAVSMQHLAKISMWSVEEEFVDNALSLPSTFDLMELEDVVLPPLDIPLKEDGVDIGNMLLSTIEALTTKVSNDGLSMEKYVAIGSSFLSFAVSQFVFVNYPSSGEPLLCQLRNHCLSPAILAEIGKRCDLPSLIGGSDFFPGVTWIPPGMQVFKNLGEIASKNGVNLNVFEELLVVPPQKPNNKAKDRRRSFPQNPLEKLLKMSQNELEDFAHQKAVLNKLEAVPTAAAKVSASTSGTATTEISIASTSAQATETTTSISNPSEKAKKEKKPTNVIKHATFTHTNLFDYNIANGLSALVGAFFTNSGRAGAYKILQWMNFVAPDADGNRKFLDSLDEDVTMSVHEDRASELFQQFETLESIIQYNFKNKKLLIQAFTHPTYPSHNLQDCYQRLEFLGDAILDLLLTHYIFTHPPGEKTPTDLQNIRSALVNNVTYASLSVRNGFNKYLLSMSKPLMDMIDNFVVFQESVQHHCVGYFNLVSDEDCRGPKHIEVPKVLCDIFEALAGAVYLDSGGSLDTVWRIFYRLMQHELDVFWEKKDLIPPTMELKSWMDKENIPVEYIRNTGKKTAARGREICKVRVGPYGHYFGMGTTRSRAKEAAAKLALKLIKEENRFIKDQGDRKLMLLC